VDKAIPIELARKGITGVRHDLPAGMEVNCARDLALIFGDEIRALIASKAEVPCENLSRLPSI